MSMHVALALSDVCPMGQLVQVVSPAVLVTDPTAQVRQSVLRTVVEYFPTVQAIQADAPDTE